MQRPTPERRTAMIYDKLENIGRYKGMNKHLDTAIDYILHNDLSSRPSGRTELDGDNVYINVMEAAAGPLETRKYEIHKKYMDIQIDLAGTEAIHTGDMSAMSIESYDAASDFGSVQCPDLASCTIGPGNFLLCMAEEPHKPGIAVSDDIRLKKCVFKVHI